MFADLSLMNDIKQRSGRYVTRRDRAVRWGPCRQEHPEQTSHVKLRVTPLWTLMVQELLSLRLRFLGQRRGQAYSESKSPSHTLHTTRLIPSSDPHRKRIRHLGLHYRLSSNSKLERSIKRWHRLGQDLQRYGPQLQHKSLHRIHSPKLSSSLHLCEQHHRHHYSPKQHLHRILNARTLRL